MRDKLKNDDFIPFKHERDRLGRLNHRTLFKNDKTNTYDKNNKHVV